MIKIIRDIEEEGPLSTFSRLCEMVAERYSQDIETISPAIVRLRINEWEIKTKTVKTKRSKSRKKRTVQLKGYDFTILENHLSPHCAKGTVEKLKAGNLLAAIKLKCQDCSSFQRQEVKDCKVFTCPLHPVRGV